jgi:transcriptional regulator with XRE-family HTH domain
MQTTEHDVRHKPKPSLIKAIKTFIRHKHTNQKYIAKATGLSESTLSKYMRGEERKRGWDKIEQQLSEFLSKNQQHLFETKLCE